MTERIHVITGPTFRILFSLKKVGRLLITCWFQRSKRFPDAFISFLLASGQPLGTNLGVSYLGVSRGHTTNLLFALILKEKCSRARRVGWMWPRGELWVAVKRSENWLTATYCLYLTYQAVNFSLLTHRFLPVLPSHPLPTAFLFPF